MKIAVCFNDIFDLTKGKLLRIVFNNFYKKYNFDIDYFIHSWNFDNVRESIKLFSCKKFIIDDITVYNSRPRIVNEQSIKYSQNSVINAESSKLFSLMRVGELKRDYEIENGFYYDICININFDMIYDRSDIILFLENNILNNKININTIYPISFSNVESFPFEFVDYSIFLSDSQTFNILSSFYKFLPIINENIFNENSKLEEVFAYYIRMFRLNIDLKK